MSNKTFQYLLFHYHIKKYLISLNYLNSDKDLNDYFPKSYVFEILPIFNQIIENRRNGIELNKGKCFSEGIIKQYDSFYNRFEKYSKINKIKYTNQDIIKKDFILDFQSYLTRNGYMLNSVSNSLKSLKTFLNVMVNNEIIPFNPFEKFKIQISWERGVGIALDVDEMDQLYNLDLSDRPSFERCRDQFMILCLTGLRVSDLNEFINIRKDGDVVVVENQKTNGISYIPMFIQLEELLNKYGGKFSKLVSPQRLGECLKEIGKAVPLLQRLHHTTFTKGGKKVKESKPRYMYLSSHVGRRTAASFLANIGVEYHIIQLITGHKSMRDLETYLRVDKRNMMKNVIDKVNASRSSSNIINN
jgi:site-specific recombinase XerD